MRNFDRRLKGFTLVELIVVIGILAALLAIVLVAINPGRQFAQANNTQRRSDVNAILNSVSQYAADNRGALPTGIDLTPRTICGPTDPDPLSTCPDATSVDPDDTPDSHSIQKKTFIESKIDFLYGRALRPIAELLQSRVDRRSE